MTSTSFLLPAAPLHLNHPLPRPAARASPRVVVPLASWLSESARRTRHLLSRLSTLRAHRPRNSVTNPPSGGNLPPGGAPPNSGSYLFSTTLLPEASLPPPLSPTADLGDGRTRIMLLISDTGGGHRASAQALAAAFEELYPAQVDCLIVDFWTEIVGRPFVRFPEAYSFFAKNPPLWRAAWNYGRFPITRRLTEEFSNMVGNQNFRNALADFRPHLIVSVHPLTQFIPLRVLRTLPNAPPFVTVCTDLGGAHPTWFHRDVDLCFVPSNRVRRIAHRCGLRDSQLRQFGLPVRPAFWRDPVTKPVMRSALGLREGPPVVLVVGGGDGVGGVGRIAVSLAATLEAELGPDGAQIVIVCGKNERLRAGLAKRDWPVNVVVKGFVQNMSEWMSAADLIVSKAGPGTIAEALIRGLPIVLSGFLPGQEAPNVSFVTEAGVGAFSRDPATIADIVTEWVSDPQELRLRSKRAKEMGRPNATYDIVREMAKLVPLENNAALRSTPIV